MSEKEKLKMVAASNRIIYACNIDLLPTLETIFEGKKDKDNESKKQFLKKDIETVILLTNQIYTQINNLN